MNNNNDDLTTAYLVGYEKAKDEYKPRWRKYPEEKPLLGGDYLCHHMDDFYIVYEYDTESGFMSYETMDNADNVVGAWMPIPDLED